MIEFLNDTILQRIWNISFRDYPSKIRKDSYWFIQWFVHVCLRYNILKDQGWWMEKMLIFEYILMHIDAQEILSKLFEIL